MIRGLIFDFDGLILDTEVPDFQAWQELYRDQGAELSLSTWGQVIGRGFGEDFHPFAQLEQQLGRPVDRETLGEKRNRRELELIEQQAILPGVQDYLAGAKRLGLKLAVASSSPREWVDGHLKRIGLFDQFDTIRCLDDVAQPKPAPDLFNAALEALAIQADEAIVFEDSPHGVTAANQAGIFCVAVPNALTRQLGTDHADLTLSSLAEYGRLRA
jgi:HAD superfamily hydrolase (TIGR01509 family)